MGLSFLASPLHEALFYALLKRPGGGFALVFMHCIFDSSQGTKYSEFFSTKINASNVYSLRYVLLVPLEYPVSTVRLG